MNIVTIIELENTEVEELLNLETSFDEFKIEDFGIETCIDYYVNKETQEKLDPDTAVEQLFEKLKEKEIIPNYISHYSFEIPGCEKLKNKNGEFTEEPSHKVILSYTVTK